MFRSILRGVTNIVTLEISMLFTMLLQPLIKKQERTYSGCLSRNPDAYVTSFKQEANTSHFKGCHDAVDWQGFDKDMYSSFWYKEIYFDM